MKNKKITVDLQNLVIVIIYFSIIFFNGGVYHQIEIGGLNRYFDLIFIIFYLIMPIISSYILLNYFKNQTFTFTIQPFSVIIGAFIFLFIFTKSLNHQNLFGDEYYYTFGCFKIVNALITTFKIDEISLFNNFSYSAFLRIFIGVLWFGSFLFLKYIFSHQTNIRKNRLFLISLFVLKLILILVNPSYSTHPPLNYFPTSIFIVLFGMNTISIKSSIIFVNVLLIIYLYNRLKLSKEPFIVAEKRFDEVTQDLSKVPQQERCSMLQKLIIVSRADGVIDDEERDIIESACTKLDIPKNFYSKIMDYL